MQRYNIPVTYANNLSIILIKLFENTSVTRTPVCHDLEGVSPTFQITLSDGFKMLRWTLVPLMV